MRVTDTVVVSDDIDTYDYYESEYGQIVGRRTWEAYKAAQAEVNRLTSMMERSKRWRR